MKRRILLSLMLVLMIAAAVVAAGQLAAGGAALGVHTASPIAHVVPTPTCPPNAMCAPYPGL